DKVLDALLEAVDVPVPQGLVDEEVHRHLEAENRLEDDEHRAEVTEETRKQVRTQLLLDAVADKEEVSVNQAELVEYLVQTAPQYGMDPNSFAQMVDQAGQVPALVGDVRRRKALAVVLEHAKVTDASGNEVDLDELVPGMDESEGAFEDVESAESAESADSGDSADSADSGDSADSADSPDEPSGEGETQSPDDPTSIRL
ncbi:MAG TPA: trigger factor, partial [Actinomycetales bacterium]|nr:trigger factor [Actinomycetales bacterium]